MSSPLKVLVVGASIAGPTTAYWLAKAGANVTVIERFSNLRTSGQSVDIRTTGVKVMRKMPGMEAAVRAKRPPIDGFSWVNDNGKTFATMLPTGDPDHQSLVSEFEIFRGDLGEILYDLTKDNERIKYVFGEQLASLQQQNGGRITAKFTNGLLAADYDLVVACDGSTSRTRAMGLECGVRDYMIPLNTWCSFFTIRGDLLAGSSIGQAWSTIGGRWIAVGGDPSGVKSRVVAWNVHPRKDFDAMRPFYEAQKAGVDALKQCIAKSFRGLGWKSDEIMDGMLETDDFYTSEMVQVKPPTLCKGRFVLVGDAGYGPGPTGAGTTLAMTGGYVLAGEILRHAGDLAAGLAAYETRMRPIITDMQKIPPGFPGVLAPQTVWGIRLRNLIIRIICWSAPVLQWAGGLFAGALGKDKHPLPDYEWPE